MKTTSCIMHDAAHFHPLHIIENLLKLPYLSVETAEIERKNRLCATDFFDFFPNGFLFSVLARIPVPPCALYHAR